MLTSHLKISAIGNYHALYLLREFDGKLTIVAMASMMQSTVDAIVVFVTQVRDAIVLVVKQQGLAQLIMT